MKKLQPIKLAIAGIVLLGSIDAVASSFELQITHPGIYDVYIDGQMYPVRGNQLRVNHLPPGRTEIEVVHHNRDPRRNRRAASRLIYRDIIRLPAQTLVAAKLGHHGMVLDYAPLRINQPTYCAPQVDPYTPQAYGMHPQDFEQLIYRIDQTAFDQTKMDIARVAIRNHGINTRQMAFLLAALSFDSHRLELAKFGYRYCGDPVNYYRLANAFTFNSNAQRLMQYIS